MRGRSKRKRPKLSKTSKNVKSHGKGSRKSTKRKARSETRRKKKRLNKQGRVQVPRRRVERPYLPFGEKQMSNEAQRVKMCQKWGRSHDGYKAAMRYARKWCARHTVTYKRPQLCSKGVVYIIVFKNSKKVYVGSTIESVLRRWKNHIHDASRAGETWGKCDRKIAALGVKNATVLPIMSLRKPQGFQRQGQIRRQWEKKLQKVENEFIKHLKTVRNGLNGRHNCIEAESARQSETGDNPGRSADNDYHAMAPQCDSLHEKSPETNSQRDICFNGKCTFDCGKLHPATNTTATKTNRQTQAADMYARYKRIASTLLSKARCGEVLRVKRIRLNALEIRKVTQYARSHKKSLKEHRTQVVHFLDRAQQELGKKRKLPAQIVKVGFTKLADKIPFRQMLKSEDSLAMLTPQLASIVRTRPPMVSYTYERNVGEEIMNNAFPNFDPAKALNSPCDCNKNEISKFTEEHEGHRHVWTVNMDICENEELRNMMKKGAKFKLANDDANTVANFHDAIDRLAENFLRMDRYASPESLNGWRQTMKDKVSTSVAQKSDNKKRETISSEARRALELMQEKYVITYLDKAAGTFIVICKKLYLELLEEELAKNEIYEKVDESEKSILLRHAAYRESAGFKGRWCRMEELYNRLPKFKAIAKYHKKPKLVLRFLVCSKQSSTEVISKALNKMFNSTEQAMTQMWQETLEEAKVPSVHFPILKNTKEVEDLARMFSHKLDRKNTVHTLDFSTLYTLIDQKILVQRLSKLVDRVFERLRKHGCDRLGVGTEDALWLKRGEKDKGVVFDAAKFKDALKFLISNTYFKHGKSIYRQKLGIPMGTSAGVALANLFLFTYEHDYIETEIANGNPDACRMMEHFGRYIDDIIVFGAPEFIAKRYDVYPEEMLELNVEGGTGNEAFYLDLLIQLTKKGKILLTVFDKFDQVKYSELKACLVKYPAIDSGLSQKCKYNVLLSEIPRHAVTTRKSAFVRNVARLCHSLRTKGYSLTMIRLTAMKALRRVADAKPQWSTTAERLWNEIRFRESKRFRTWYQNRK